MTQGEFIKSLRLQRGYSQEYLGNLLNIGYQAYGRYEQDKATLSVPQAKILSEIYNLTMDQLTMRESSGSIGSMDEKVDFLTLTKPLCDISITVKLDGSDGVLKNCFSMLERINMMIKEENVPQKLPQTST